MPYVFAFQLMVNTFVYLTLVAMISSFEPTRQIYPLLSFILEAKVVAHHFLYELESRHLKDLLIHVEQFQNKHPVASNMSFIRFDRKFES
jgi:hypothetical protein